MVHTYLVHCFFVIYFMNNGSLISPLAIAPMIDWTYSHFRILMRLLAPQALLYTEMQTIGAVINKPRQALYYQEIEKTSCLTIGRY